MDVSSHLSPPRPEARKAQTARRMPAAATIIQRSPAARKATTAKTTFTWLFSLHVPRILTCLT